MPAQDPYTLPPDLPVPEDDGAARHLPGARVPPVALPSSDGGALRLDEVGGRAVVFAYPRMGRPGEEMPDGWDLIPGARGCTPQACGIRDEHAEFERLGVRVFGLATEEVALQRAAVERLHLPYPLLSDERLELARGMQLPTFEAGGMTLLKRLTLFLRDGVVEDVHYPVFPPDRSAAEALRRLARL